MTHMMYRDDANTVLLANLLEGARKATAQPGGLFDYNGRQTFACVSHFSGVEKLILGWADFSARERFKLLHNASARQN